MTPEILLLTVLAFVVSHFLGGIAAYGSCLLALPLLLWITHDLETAVLLMLLVGNAQSCYLLYFTWREVVWREFWRIVLIMGGAMPAGFLALAYLPQRPLLVALGVILCVAGSSHLWLRRYGSHWRPPRWALVALLLIAGVIHGAFVTGGVALVLYVYYVLPRKEQFRGTLSMAWVVMNFGLIGAKVAVGAFTRPVLVLGAINILPVLAVTWLAQRVATRMPQDRFAGFVAWSLIVAGVVTAGRALGG